MKSFRFLIIALPSILLACGATDGTETTEDKGAATQPPFDGKADIGDRVVDSGELGFGPDAAVSGAFTEDLQFFGWRLGARENSTVTVEVTQKGSSRGLDTTLYLYGPKASGGGYGISAIAFDDDDGWGALSRVRDLSLPAAGEYLVVVGTYDGRGRGNFRVQATCSSGDCSPEPVLPEPTVGECHPDIAGAILACADDLATDPDYDPASSSRVELLETCTDAEPVAGARDALCAQTNPPADVCATSFEQFATTYLPACGREVVNQELDSSCVFGSTYPDLRWRPGPVVIVSERTLVATDSLSPLEQEQIVEAVKTSAYSDITTIEEAFAAVDDGLVNQMELWDASNRRAFTSYEVGAGDNSFGMIFDRGTVTPAARIGDSDLYDCSVFWGKEMRRCEDATHCAQDLTCVGALEGAVRGRCIDLAKDDETNPFADCPTGTCPEGFVCASGICNPGWMRGRFVSEPDLAIPDNQPAGADAQLAVFGLSTVSTNVELDLHISHARPSDLIVSLINPAGTEGIVFDRQPVNEIYLRSVPVYAFPGDESANGVWTLRAVDTVTGSTGVIRSFALTVTSRWD
jgi:hypothetical protein